MKSETNNGITFLKSFLIFSYLLFTLISCNAAEDKSNSLSQEKEKINKTISSEDFAQMLENEVQLIDVRTAQEFSGGFIKNAENIDVNAANFSERVKKFDKQKPILVYCLSGGRSANAAEMLSDMGFVEVYNLKGGIMNWQADSRPLSNASTSNSKSEMSLKDYNQKVLGNKKVLIDFYAPWCVPCKKMAPYLDKIKNENSTSLSLIKINADENKNLCKELGITGLPVLEYYENGKLIWRNEGMIEEVDLRKKMGL